MRHLKLVEDESHRIDYEYQRLPTSHKQRKDELERYAGRDMYDMYIP